MSKANGFLQLRRGFWEHVRDGRMTITQALAFVYICSEADTRSGIWKGSAKSLSGELGIPERTARDVLEKMEHGDYIRRFAVPGRHSCYPILVHKFLITDGEHGGEQLDALNSTDANTLRYLPAEIREQGVEHSAAQKRKRIGKEKKPAAKTTPPSDPRREVFLGFALKEFEVKHGLKPSWVKADFVQYDSFLKHNPGISVEEMQRRFRNYLASTEPFTVHQGGSLTYFVKKFVVFARGPILAAPQKSDRAVLVDPEELRRRRTEITPQGQAILDRTGGVLQ